VFHDEILICNAFDVAVASQIPPQKTNTLLQKIRCVFGFHFWGFTHCLCCEKRDGIVYESLMLKWHAMTTAERDCIIDAMILRSKAVGLDPDTFIWKQIRLS